MAEQKVYDFFTLNKNGVSNTDILNLGSDNVKMLSPELAYQHHGEGQDPEQFKQQYDAVSKTYLELQKDAWLLKRAAGQGAYASPAEPGISKGIGIGGSDIQWATDSQIDAEKGVFSSGQLTNLKFEDQPAGTLVHDMQNRQWRIRRPDEDVSGQEVNSIFGTPDMYSSWINKSIKISINYN